MDSGRRVVDAPQFRLAEETARPTGTNKVPRWQRLIGSYFSSASGRSTNDDSSSRKGSITSRLSTRKNEVSNVDDSRVMASMLGGAYDPYTDTDYDEETGMCDGDPALDYGSVDSGIVIDGTRTTGDSIRGKLRKLAALAVEHDSRKKERWSTVRERSDRTRTVIEEQEAAELKVRQVIANAFKLSKFKEEQTLRISRILDADGHEEITDEDMKLFYQTSYRGPRSTDDLDKMLQVQAMRCFERTRLQGAKGPVLSLKATCDTLGSASRAWAVQRTAELSSMQGDKTLPSTGPGGVQAIGHPLGTGFRDNTDLVDRFLEEYSVAKDDCVSAKEGERAEAAYKAMIKDPAIAGALVESLRHSSSEMKMVKDDADNQCEVAMQRLADLKVRIASNRTTRKRAMTEAQTYQRELKSALQKQRRCEKVWLTSMSNYEQVRRQVEESTLDLHSEKQSKIVKGVAEATQGRESEFRHLQDAALARSSMNADGKRVLEEISMAQQLDPDGTGQQLDPEFLKDYGFGDILEYLGMETNEDYDTPNHDPPISSPEPTSIALHQHVPPTTTTVLEYSTETQEFDAFEQDELFEAAQ